MAARELIIYDYQDEHYSRLLDILNEHHFYFDTSIMGTGKTHIAAAVAIHYRLALLVICPVSVKSIWEKVVRDYDIPFVCRKPFSFESNASKRGYQPEHKLLERVDDVTDGGRHVVEFYPTEKYLNLVSQGVLLIIDEAEKIKNNNTYHKACAALIEPILRTESPSRVAFISGTPFVKKEHVVNMLRMVGFIGEGSLGKRIKGEGAELQALGDLVELCSRYDQDEVDNVMQSYDLRTDSFIDVAYDLFIRIIHPRVFSEMPVPDYGYCFDNKNLFVRLTPEEEEQLAIGIKMLRNAVGYSDEHKTVDANTLRKNKNIKAKGSEKQLSKVTPALMAIHAAKIGGAVRNITSRLNRDRTCKVIVFLRYLNDLREMYYHLEKYGAKILNGDTPEAERTQIINEFQQPNLNIRVIVTNTKVGGYGYSMHDTHGGFRRWVFMFDDYSVSANHQGPYRCYRNGVRSDVNVRHIYGIINDRELSIINAIARGSDIMKETLPTQALNGVVFPGDLECVFEGDGYTEWDVGQYVRKTGNNYAYQLVGV